MQQIVGVGLVVVANKGDLRAGEVEGITLSRTDDLDSIRVLRLFGVDNAGKGGDLKVRLGKGLHQSTQHFRVKRRFVTLDIDDD